MDTSPSHSTAEVDRNSFAAPLLVAVVGPGVSLPQDDTLAFLQVDDSDQAEELLDREDPDVLLIDLAHLGRSAMSTIRTLSHHSRKVPLMVLADESQDALIAEALHAGAADYLMVEDLTTPRLANRIRMVWRTHHWRTPQLVNNLLREQHHQHQKMQGIARLAGGIAHDFNNLLTPILGFAHMISDEASGDRNLREYAAEILRAAERAAELNKSLLAFSRKRINRKQAVDLNEIMDALLPRIREQLTDRHRLDLQLDATITTLSGDAGLLDQVLLSLSHNAIQAMPRSGILTIATDNVRPESVQLPPGVAAVSDDFLLITIQDTGAGIPEEDQHKIFEPFFTTRELGQGHGLGLSMAYGIVESHDGYIQVSSQPGRGTIIRVYLPVETDLPATSGPEETSSGVGDELPTGNETVMVVDDEPAVRELAARLLSSLGYHVLVAESGGDALLLMETRGEDIALILTDMIMPRMDGERMVERLRKIHPDFKVLYSSGYSIDSEVVGDTSEVAANFLPKPYSRRKLAHAVRRVLDRA